MNVTALVLCGGLGTRLRPRVADRPKSMAEVRGRPFLEWLLRSLRAQGITDVVLATGHMGNAVRSRFGDGAALDMSLLYSEEAVPMGTGGAVRNALGDVRSDPFLVLNGDSWCRFDVARLQAFHQLRGAAATMVVVPAEGDRYGGVVLDAAGRVGGFHEKQAVDSGLVNAGIYLMARAVVTELPPAVNSSMENDVLPSLCGHGLFGMAVEGPLVDIGTPESYDAAEAALAGDLDALLQTSPD